MEELTSGRPDPDPRQPGVRLSGWVARAGQVLGQGKVAAAIVVVVVMAGVVAVSTGFGPSLLSSPSRHRAPARVAGESPASAGDASATGRAATARPAALDWPVRGDLAEDAAFANAVLAKLARSRAAGLPAQEMMYAGTLPDGSRLALLGSGQGSEAPGNVTIISLHFAPVGSPRSVAYGQPSNDFLRAEKGVTGWAGHLADGHVHALVLVAPGPMRAEVSAEVRYAPDGSASRTWRRVTSRTGAALIDLGRPHDGVVGVRRGDDDLPSPSVLLIVDPQRRSTPNSSGRSNTIPGLHSRSYAGVSPTLTEGSAASVVSEVLGSRQVAVSVIWSGRLTSTRLATLLLARRADGPTFQILVSGEPDGSAKADIRAVPRSQAAIQPWLFVPDASQGHVLLINPAAAARGGTAVIGRPGGRSRRVPIGRDGLADLARDQTLAYDLYGTPVTVRSGSRRLGSGRPASALPASGRVAAGRAATGRLVVRGVLPNPDTADLFAVAEP